MKTIKTIYLINSGEKDVDPNWPGDLDLDFALVIAETRGKAKALFLAQTTEWLEWISRLQIFKIGTTNDNPCVIKSSVASPHWLKMMPEHWDKLKSNLYPEYENLNHYLGEM